MRTRAHLKSCNSFAEMDLLTDIVWTHQKPTQPGVYWLRGLKLAANQPFKVVGIEEIKGRLVIQVVSTKPRKVESWYNLAEISNELEWYGPV